MNSKSHMNMTSNLPSASALAASGSFLEAPRNGNITASVHAKVGDARRSHVVVGLAGEGHGEDAGSQNVQVILRVRPLTLSYHTQSDGQGHQLVSNLLSEEQNQAQNRCIKAIVDNKMLQLHKSDEQFTFDFIAGEDITQDVMFQRLGKPIVDFCIQGYNSTLFAYGQTGSGKTHTIQGKESKQGSQEPKDDQRGILPRQFEYLFSEIRKIHTKHDLMKERL